MKESGSLVEVIDSGLEKIVQPCSASFTVFGADDFEYKVNLSPGSSERLPLDGVRYVFVVPESGSPDVSVRVGSFFDEDKFSRFIESFYVRGGNLEYRPSVFFNKSKKEQREYEENALSNLENNKYILGNVRANIPITVHEKKHGLPRHPRDSPDFVSQRRLFYQLVGNSDYLELSCGVSDDSFVCDDVYVFEKTKGFSMPVKVYKLD